MDSNNLETIPTSIGNLTNLKELDLSYNRIKKLPESIGNLKNLETLNLDRNKLTNIPENIENMVYLKKLNLMRNELNDPNYGIIEKLKKRGVEVLSHSVFVSIHF